MSFSGTHRLAELGDCLDPRQDPTPALRRAAHIPTEELPGRLHELPPKNEPVRIADVGPRALRAVEFLRAGGRNAVLDRAESGDDSHGPFRLWRPNDFLMSIFPRLSGGTALDLGCGNGREVLAMAAHGFHVIGCDLLPEALETGRDLASRYLIGQGDPPITWLLGELERNGPPIGPFDLITSFRYLHRPLLSRMGELLNPGGSFILETFTAEHRERHGKPRSDAHVLQPGEAPTLVPGLAVVHYDEAWRGEIHTARLWARKADERQKRL